MLAVCCSERIHNPAVSIRGKLLGELLLGSLHCLLCLLVCRILLVDAYRLAFLFRIVAEILEKKNLTRLEGSCQFVSLLAVRSELYRYAELLAYCVNNL